MVILQDEQLVVREIQRNMQRTAAAAAAVAVAAAGRRRSAAAGALPCRPAVGASRRFPPPARDRRRRDEHDRSRPTKAAARWRRSRRPPSMKAERAAIEHTLRQVHWNRRKAAQILGVSYKTLLNKIKECGISRA